MTRYPATPSQRSSGEGPFATGNLNQIYQHYYSRLLGVATTRYRWLGLGPWIDPMRVEWLLVTQGLCAFTFVNQRLGMPGGKLVENDMDRPGKKFVYNDRFTVTQAYTTGTLDDTFTPSGYRTLAPTGATGIAFNTFMPLDEWKGVPIWGDNLRSYYDQQTIAFFAQRLSAAALAVDTNLRQTMRGKVVATSQDKLLSTQTFLESAGTGADTIVSDPQLIDGLKVLDLGVHPDTVERSHVVAERIWSEALEALGVESPAAEKKERLVVSEIGADNSQVAAVRRMTLTPRKQAASLINRRYFGGEPVVEVVDQWD